MANAQDADLILKLYELRREPVMREARNFMIATFWPGTVDEYLVVQHDLGGQNSAYLRQFVSYWEMAASFVLRGALDPDLFFDNNNELFFVFAKMQPLRVELEAKAGIKFMPRTAELLEKYPAAKERFERTSKAVENRRSQRTVSQKLDL